MSTDHSASGPYTSLRGVFVLSIFVVLCAAQYITAQVVRRGLVADVIFVSMLLGATLILLIGMRSFLTFVRNKGVSFYAFVLSTADPEEVLRRHAELSASLSSTQRTTVAGLVYGTSLGFAPWMLGVWREDTVLQASLGVFLGSVNFVTGIAFYGLVLFLVESFRLGKLVQVGLWQSRNPSTEFLTGAVRRIGLLASVYVALCISSIVFSVLSLNAWVMAYSGFAAVTIVAAIVVPSVPVARRIQLTKDEALNQLDEQIQREFQRTLSQVGTLETGEAFGKLQSLLLLRERIESVSSWPFKTKSLTAAFSVVLVTAVPVVLQYLLERASR